MRPYTFAQKARKLQVRIKEIRQSPQCPCPSKYELKHHQGDKERLEILADRRATGTVFTAEEDAEEAHRMARYDSFLDGPEIAALRRLADLRESKRAADRGYGPPLPPAQEAALRLPNPGRGSTYRSGKTVQTTGSSSVSASEISA